MDEFIGILKEPWPWYVAGPSIFLVMALLYWIGYNFGISSTFRTICAASGGGKVASFFSFNWKKEVWNLVFVAGTILGGFIAAEYLSSDERNIAINPKIAAELSEFGMQNAGKGFQPDTLFGEDALNALSGWIFLVLGGLLVGFGSRYAGGCTSGHAISGLSSLQFPSLLAVIGFFAGGLLVTYLVLPYLLGQ